MRRPFRLALSLLATLVVAASAADPARTPDVIASLRPYITSKALAGAVTLVVDKDRVLSHQAIGLADIAGKQAMAPDALFWIASMSKPLTAIVLMMLVEEGKVELAAPVARYLPEFTHLQVTVKNGTQATLRAARQTLTVRHLLAHTSGLPFVLPQENGKLDVMTIAESVRLSAQQPLAFDPGTGWSYSNCGIKVAGRIIEVISGKPYEEVMRERLFVPLAMVDTTSFPTAAQVARIAKSYRPTATGGQLTEVPISYLTYPLDAPTRFACPGGGLFSSAPDLGRFARMLLNGGQLDGRRYLSAESMKQMTTMQTGVLHVGFGLGFALPGNDYGHGGAYNTDLWIDTLHGLGTIFLVQHDSFGAGTDGGDILMAFKQAAVVAFTRR